MEGLRKDVLGDGIRRGNENGSRCFRDDGIGGEEINGIQILRNEIRGKKREGGGYFRSNRIGRSERNGEQILRDNIRREKRFVNEIHLKRIQ